MGSPAGVATVTKESWRPYHEKILIEAVNGLNKVDIAKKLKIGVPSVSRVISSPIFKMKLRDINGRIMGKVIERRSETGNYDSIAEARRIITEAAIEAAEKLRKLARSGESQDRVQLDACKDILDRSGLKPIEVIETRERVFTPEDEQKAKAILAEVGDVSTRLTNQSSPFILRDGVRGALESSVTDRLKDGKQEEQALGT